jgi:hypothetical protein
MRLGGPLRCVPWATPSDPEKPGTCPQDLSPMCCLSGRQKAGGRVIHRAHGSAALSRHRP